MIGAVAAMVQREFGRYDVSFGLGVDPSTRRYMLQPNSADWTVSAPPTNRAIIIFYTPSGANTGPTNIPVTVSIAGVPTVVQYASYTRTTLAGCSALVRTSTGPAPSYGDWVLFPGQTLTFPVNGESSYGEIKNQSGLSRVYPTVFGTYDPAARTDPTRWNKLTCKLDFSIALYTPLTSGFFYNNGRNENNIAILNMWHYCPNPFTINNFYFNTGLHSGFLFERCIVEGSALIQNTSDLTLNISLAALTSSGTTAVAKCSSTFSLIVQLASAAGQTLSAAIFGATGGTTAYNGTYNITAAGLAAAPASITSSGTTATINMVGIGTSVSSGLTQWAVQNVTPSAFNGTYTLTASGADAATYTFAGAGNASASAVGTVFPTYFTYTFAGTGGAAATGTIQVSLRGDGYADAMASCDWVINQCGLGYSSQALGAHAGSLFLSGSVKRARVYDTVFMHGGWGRGCPRSAAAWSPGTTKTPITDLTHSAGVVTALTPNTGSLAVGGYVLPGATTASGANSYNKLSKILSVTPGVSFTYSTDPASSAIMGSATVTGYITGNTLTISSVTKGTVGTGQIVYGPGAGITQCNITSGSGSTWTVDGSAQNVGSAGSPVAFNCCATWVDPAVNGYNGDYGDGPDTLSHGKYIQNQVYDYREYDSVTAWDCVNSKYTGGPIYLEGCVDIRGPRSFISDTLGNDTTANSGLGWSWPDGAQTKCVNHLQVFSDDVTYAAAHQVLNGQSFAASLQGCSAGSYYSNGLILNATNPSATNRIGINGAATPVTPPYRYTPALSMQHSVCSNWGPTDLGSNSNGIDKSYAFNITDDSSALPAAKSSAGVTTPNVSNQLISATPSPFQAGLTAARALDIANTFRTATPELSGVTVGGNDLATEQKCFDFMMRNPDIRWARKLQAHWRQSIGR